MPPPLCDHCVLQDAMVSDQSAVHSSHTVMHHYKQLLHAANPDRGLSFVPGMHCGLETCKEQFGEARVMVAWVQKPAGEASSAR